MKTNKKFRLIALLSISLAVSGSIVAVTAAKGFGDSKTSANEIVEDKVVFSREGSSQKIVSNDYYYTSGQTKTKDTLYLRNASNLSLGNNYVAVMCGSLDKGSVEPSITFTNKDSGTEMYAFQRIASISAVSTGDSARNLTVYRSNDGENWTDAGVLSVSTSGGSNDKVFGAKYIKLGYEGTYSVYLTSFTVNYVCSPDDDLDKVLIDIKVKTAPTKTEYQPDEYFDPTGLVITEIYSDLSEEDVPYLGNEALFSFSPSLTTKLSESDTSITITYKEKSCEQAILVGEEEEIDPVGSYTATAKDKNDNDADLGLTINNDGTGQYTMNNHLFEVATQNFTWTFNSDTNVITFTYKSGGSAAISFYGLKLFQSLSSGQTNEGVATTTSITLYLYNAAALDNPTVFTKA